MPDSTKNIYIFEAVDPLNNYVYLTENTLEKHIYDAHVEMMGEVDLIKSTIEKPDKIYERTNEFQKVKHDYIKQHNKDELNSYGRYIKIIVDRELQGQISTAYCTPKSTQNDKLIYKKSDE